jgi:hypothetical protein
MAISVKYSDGSEKKFSKTSQSLETQLAIASYMDNIDEVKAIIDTKESIDFNASVWHSPTKGNGTPLILTGLREIAQLLLDNGADINFVYNTGTVKITALDSAYQELKKQSVINDTQAQKQIQDLIVFLESKGAKRYDESGER